MKIAPPPIGTAFVLIVSTTRLVFRISSESVPMTNGHSSPETLKTSPEISQNYPKWRPGVVKEAHEVLDMPRMQHAAGLGGSGETPICDFVDILLSHGRHPASFRARMGAEGGPKATQNPSINRCENRCPKSMEKTLKNHEKTIQNRYRNQWKTDTIPVLPFSCFLLSV